MRKEEKTIRVLLSEDQVDEMFNGMGEAKLHEVNEPVCQIIINEIGDIKSINIVGEHVVRKEYNLEVG